MITMVIRTQTDMVFAFDESGNQIPEYQGSYEDAKLKILRDSISGTVFKHWYLNSPEPEDVARENW